MLIGGIECGGTKFICRVCEVKDNDYSTIESIRIKTKKPDETMKQVVDFFNQYEIVCLGVGSFGPIDLNNNSETYGMILNTPKLSWKNFNIYKYLKDYIKKPIYLNTDVNLACYAEVKLGDSKNLNNVLYITIGTGVGVGVIINKNIYQGVTHSEMGHIGIVKDNDDRSYNTCTYHKNCLEGYISGPAINRNYSDINYPRLGRYLAQAVINYTYILAPERIIVGGGIGRHPETLEELKRSFVKQNNSYFNYENLSNIDTFLTSPSLGDDSGILGAIFYAYDQYNL